MTLLLKKLIYYHMKQVIFIIATVLVTMSGCKTKTPTDQVADCCSADKDSYEIVMNIPFKIKPEHVFAFKTAFDKCRAGTMEEEACLAYDLFQSYSDSTEFHLYERWTNKPGHQAHMQTEHIKVYFAETEGMHDQPATKTVVVTVCPKINNAQ